MDDTSTGIDKQDESATKYAAVHGHDLVATAADADVSGSVPPWDRPRLGPYLNDADRRGTYDGIVAAYFDRLGRNAYDLAGLRRWAEDHDKRLIVISPSLQWPPDEDDFSSALIWDVLARLAEIELRMITKRNRDTQAFLRSENYLVGKAPWGWQISPVPGSDHKTLAPDPDRAPIILGMVDAYLSGKSYAAIARWLQDTGVPTETGAAWDAVTVRQMLNNPVLIGRRMDAEGRVILRFPPLLDMDTWNRLSAAQNARKGNRGAPAREPAMLTGIARCAVCKSPMYRVTAGARRPDGGRYEYYRCSGTGKCKNLIPVAQLDRWVSDWIFAYADHEVTETVTLPGSGPDLELFDNDQAMRETLAAQDRMSTDEFMSKVAALRAERDRLLALPAVPERTETRGTGVLLGEFWQGLTTSERRQYLASSGVTVYATKDRQYLEGDPLNVVSAITGSTWSSVTGDAALDEINTEIYS